MTGTAISLVHAVWGRPVTPATEIAAIAEARVPTTLDETIEKITAIAAHIGRLDLAAVLEVETASEVLEIAKVAELKAAAIRALHRTSAEAVVAAAALEGLAVEAKRTLGEALRALDGGGKGKAKSERTEMAERLEIDPRETQRLVQLGGLPKEKVGQIVDKFAASDKRVTVRGVLEAAESPSSTEGCSTDDYYTPPEFMADVRTVFGGAIDCDPTSCLLAQCMSVKARSWSSLRSPLDPTERGRALAAGVSEAEIDAAAKCWAGVGGVKDDRLTQVVAGSVFGQPPYSTPAPTIYTIQDGYQSGLVHESIILVNTATSSAPQQELLRLSAAQLWIGKGEKHDRTRIAFIRPDGTPHKSNMYDQVGYYLGEDTTMFREVMSGWGVVTGGKRGRRRG